MIAAPANAAWSISIPGWVTNLAQTISDKVETFNAENDRRRQVTCLALGVYYESRGESLRGQKAVASVIMNRVRAPQYPDTACEVIFQPHQFSFVRQTALVPRGASWDQAIEIGHQYIDRPTGDVPYLHFTNSRIIRGARIGNHVFY